MKELLNKLAAAKAEIKATKLKKEGENTYSKYSYFTPSQIEFLVATACGNNNLLTTFDLCRNDLGVYGKLNLYDLESGKMLSTEMASAIPEIKATNVAQQLGGCSTYTERYMKRLKDNAKGYDENSPVNFADLLKGNYLLVHGMADDNVHFQNTAEMSNALIKNKKQFDTYFYPNRNHGIGGQNARIHLYTKMTSFVLEKI